MTASVWRIRVSIHDLLSIIVDSMQQQKFEVHTPFRFEAVDPGTKTAREWATYAKGQNEHKKGARSGDQMETFSEGLSHL